MKSLGLIETKGLLPAIECADVMLKSAEVRLLDKTHVGAGLVAITVTGDVSAVQTAVDAAKAALERLGIDALHSSHVIPRPDADVFDQMFASSLIGSSEDDGTGGAPQRETSVVTEPDTVEPEQPEPVKSESTESKAVELETDKADTEVETPDAQEPESVTPEAAKNGKAKKDDGKRPEAIPAESAEALQEKAVQKATVTLPVAVEQKALVTKPEKSAPAKAKKSIMTKKDVDGLWTEDGVEGVAAGLTKLTLAKLRILAREYSDLPIEQKKLSKVKKRTLVEVFKRYYSSLNT